MCEINELDINGGVESAAEGSSALVVPIGPGRSYQYTRDLGRSSTTSNQKLACG